MVEDIKLTNFLTKVEFDQLRKKHNYFMRVLMMFNIFS